MKIEPGTLCVVRSVCLDPALRGRFVVAAWKSNPGEKFSSVDMAFRISTAPYAGGSWACRATREGECLTITLENYVTGAKKTAAMRYVPLPAHYLQPISGPSIDTEETGDKSLENALVAGDLSWL